VTNVLVNESNKQRHADGLLVDADMPVTMLISDPKPMLKFDWRLLLVIQLVAFERYSEEP
jgi:hypothetical protein